MQRNNKKIFFIGRLELEKWVDILLQIIEKTQKNNFPLEFHIFGEGSFFDKLKNFDKNLVKMYGKIPQSELYSHLKNADYVLMPSRFFETFWLVALESLSYGVPVIWFREAALSDFVLPEMALSQEKPVDDFFQIISKSISKIPNIEKFSYENWQKNLRELTKNFEKILLVHDYFDVIGGAEIYVHRLKSELEKIWKKVELFAFSDVKNTKIRKRLFLSSVIFSKNFKKLSQKIEDFSPDLIWSHTILRAIGFAGMDVISQSQIPHFMTHHDIGLFVPQPSRVHSFEQIPKNLQLSSWLSLAKNFKNVCIFFIKWLIVVRIWKKIPENTLHIVPSVWMETVLKNYRIEKFYTFPHTKFDEK